MSRPRTVLLTILLLAFLLRAGLAVAHPFLGFPDSYDYDALGKALLHGRYIVDGRYAVRMPGYPVLVAAVYGVAGPHPKAVLIVQAAMGAATALLAYAIMRRVSERVGLIAAALLACDPLSVALAASLLSEVPFTLALGAMVYLALRLGDDPRRLGHWCSLGLIGAAAVYLRGSALYLAALVLPAVVALGRPYRELAAQRAWRGLAGPAVAVAIVIAALLPWRALLNAHAETRGLEGLTSLEGISLYESVYPEATGGPRQHRIDVHPAAWSSLTEAQQNNRWWQEGWGFVWQDPLRIAKLAVVKFGRTWNPGLNADEFHQPAVQVASWLWYAPLFGLALVGLLGRGMPGPMRLALVVPILYFSAVHMVFLGSVRYRVPLMPLVCMLAATGADTMCRNFRDHQRTAPARV